MPATAAKARLRRRLPKGWRETFRGGGSSDPWLIIPSRQQPDVSGYQQWNVCDRPSAGVNAKAVSTEKVRLFRAKNGPRLSHSRNLSIRICIQHRPQGLLEVSEPGF